VCEIILRELETIGHLTMTISLLDHIQEIREMVKSNPELVQRLDMTEARELARQAAEDKLIHENEVLKTALVDQDTEFCEWKVDAMERADDSFGDIHALQVQISILKAKLQSIELAKLEADNDPMEMC